MKYYLMSEDDRRALVNYLGTRPYNEVVGGIAALMGLPEAPEEKILKAVAEAMAEKLAS